jgi:hypothetical protein
MLRFRGRSAADGNHRDKGRNERRGSNIAIAGPGRAWLGPRRFLRDRIRGSSVKVFRTYRIALHQVCDRSPSSLLQSFVGGPLPPGSAYSFNPVRPLTSVWPVSALFT